MPDAEKVRKHSSRMKENFHVRFLGEGKWVTAFSYPTYNSMKNCKLPSVCRIDVLILKFVAIEVYFFVLSFDFYKENWLSKQNFPQMPMCLFSRATRSCVRRLRINPTPIRLRCPYRGMRSR